MVTLTQIEDTKYRQTLREDVDNMSENLDKFIETAKGLQQLGHSTHVEDYYIAKLEKEIHSFEKSLDQLEYRANGHTKKAKTAVPVHKRGTGKSTKPYSKYEESVDDMAWNDDHVSIGGSRISINNN